MSIACTDLELHTKPVYISVTCYRLYMIVVPKPKIKFAINTGKARKRHVTITMCLTSLSFPICVIIVPGNRGFQMFPSPAQFTRTVIMHIREGLGTKAHNSH